MARPNPLRSIMQLPLPSISYQKQKLFRPTDEDLIYTYKMINRYVFDNELAIPDIRLIQTQKCWGYCEWKEDYQNNGSYSIIRLNKNWFCPQWFVNTLAHEMAHQYQWDVYRWYSNLNANNGAHGYSFFMWREKFQHYGLTLKTSYGQKRWFKHQNFNKC